MLRTGGDHHPPPHLLIWNKSQNNNAFQWDVYRPLVDRIPACTAQEVGVCLGVSALGVSVQGMCVFQHAMGQTLPPSTPPPLWTDRHLWNHNLRKLHLLAVNMAAECGQKGFISFRQFAYPVTESATGAQQEKKSLKSGAKQWRNLFRQFWTCPFSAQFFLIYIQFHEHLAE